MLENGGGATRGDPSLFPDLVGARVAPQRCPVLRPGISSVAFARQLKTILNQVTNYKSFVFESAALVEDDGDQGIEVTIVPRANGRRLCSGCGEACPGYDVSSTEYHSPAWAAKFLDQWCTRAMRSNIEPMKKVARTLRERKELILNWFRAGGTISAGIVEGFNNKLKLITRKSYGFRTQQAYETALYQNLGALPMPEFTHRFW